MQNDARSSALDRLGGASVRVHARRAADRAGVVGGAWVDGGGVILALDPGATTGSAILDGDVLTDLRAWRRMDTRAGRMTFAAWLRTLKPSLIVVERPSNPGSRWSADGVEQLGERAGELVALCEMLHPDAPILRPWPQPQRGGEAWQPWAHAGFCGSAKDRSLQRVQRHIPRGDMIPRSPDAWDAGAIACWARWGR